jgi:hypothetical protein
LLAELALDVVAAVDVGTTTLRVVVC